MPIEINHDPFGLLGLPTEQPMGERERALFADNLARRRQYEQFQYGLAADQYGYGAQQQLWNDRLASQSQLEDQRQAAYYQRQAAQQQALDERQQLGFETQQIRELERSPFTGELPSPQQMQQTQQGIQQNRQAVAAPAMENRQRLLDAIYRGDPMAVQAGLSQGILQYTPEQQAERKRLTASIGKIDSTQNLSALEKATARRQQMSRLDQIRPQFAPDDQIPPDPVEQFQRDVIVAPDPVTGEAGAWTRDRSGALRRLEPSEKQKADIEVWKQQQLGKDQARLQEIEMEKEQRKMQFEQWKLERDAVVDNYKDESKAWKDAYNAHYGELVDAQKDAEQKQSPEALRQQAEEYTSQYFGPRPKLNVPPAPKFGPPQQQTGAALNPFGAPTQSASPWDQGIPQPQQTQPPQQTQGQMNVPPEQVPATAPAPLSPEWLATEPKLSFLGDAMRREQESGGKKTDPYLNTFRTTLDNPMTLPMNKSSLRDGGVYIIQGVPHVFRGYGNKGEFVRLP